jgi:hypothetical protein
MISLTCMAATEPEEVQPTIRTHLSAQFTDASNSFKQNYFFLQFKLNLYSLMFFRILDEITPLVFPVEPDFNLYTP